MTRHLQMDELLALRDGEGAEQAADHLDSCRACRLELERLRRLRAELRALPTFVPPRDLWPRVAARVRRRRLLRRLGYVAAGLAAAAALAGVLVARGGGGSEIEGTGREAWVAEASSTDLGPMIIRSRELESLLRSYRPSSPVYDAPTALAVSVLEDRIDILDRMLFESRALGADRQVLRGLWDERVQTLETLVELEAVQREGVWR